MSIKVSIDEKTKEMVIRTQLITPRPSKSGKNHLIATTGGNIRTEATYKGQPVTVSINAYFKPENNGKSKDKDDE